MLRGVSLDKRFRYGSLSVNLETKRPSYSRALSRASRVPGLRQIELARELVRALAARLRESNYFALV